LILTCFIDLKIENYHRKVQILGWPTKRYSNYSLIQNSTNFVSIEVKLEKCQKIVEIFLKVCPLMIFKHTKLMHCKFLESASDLISENRLCQLKIFIFKCCRTLVKKFHKNIRKKHEVYTKPVPSKIGFFLVFRSIQVINTFIYFQ
jgi:hypothetical protein